MFRVFVLLALLIVPATLSCAQPPAPPARSAGQQDLTPDQQNRYKARMEKAKAEYYAIQSNTTLSPAQKQARALTLAKKVDSDNLAILNPAQRAFVMQRRAAGVAFTKSHAAQIAQFKALQKKFAASLTSEQKAKMDAIIQQNNAQVAQIANEPGATDADKQKQASSVRKSADAQLKAVLTPAQATQQQHLQQLGTALQSQAQAVIAH